MSLTIKRISAPISVRLRVGRVISARAEERRGDDSFGWEVRLEAATPESGEEASVVSVHGSGSLEFEVHRPAQVRLGWGYFMQGEQPSPPAMGFCRYSLWWRVMEDGPNGKVVTAFNKHDLTVQSPGEWGTPIFPLEPGKYTMEAVLQMSVRVPRQEAFASALAAITESKFRVSVA